MLVTDAVVIAIEQHAKTCIKRLEIGFVLFKNKGFKKPGDGPNAIWPGWRPAWTGAGNLQH